MAIFIFKKSTVDKKKIMRDNMDIKTSSKMYKNYKYIYA